MGACMVLRINKKLLAFLGLFLSILIAFLIYRGCLRVMKYLYPLEYESIVNIASKTYGVEKECIYAIIKCESGFDSDAHSHADALGLMQITPDTFKWLQLYSHEGPIDARKLKAPYINIMYGTLLVSILREKYSDEEVVLSAYNAGETVVKRWLSDKNISADGKKLSRIPYGETRRYVGRVKMAKKIYKILYFS